MTVKAIPIHHRGEASVHSGFPEFGRPISLGEVAYTLGWRSVRDGREPDPAQLRALQVGDQAQRTQMLCMAGLGAEHARAAVAAGRKIRW